MLENLIFNIIVIMNCKNCQEKLVSQANFCSNCGQKRISKLDFKYIFEQFIEDLFNFDSKVFRTIKYLTIKPGFLSKEYIEGKRASYVPPVRLYIVLSVVFFFLIATFDFGDGKNREFKIGNAPENQEIVDGVNFTMDGVSIDVPTTELKKMNFEGTLENYLDSVTNNQGFAGYFTRKLAIAKVNDRGFADILRDQFSMFLLLFLPFFALLYATVFSRNKKGFIGHLIFNLHLNSFIIFSIMIGLVVGLALKNELIDLIWSILVVLFGQYYIIRAIMVFYERKWWAAIYKYLLLIFGYLVLAFLFIVVVFFSSILMV